ncbi:MAG: hypothetical protein FWD82_02135 [Defluviitaleaceae bacterium]|nr:hypothetical protein [Defluviitaleaceae bacterium]
MDIDIKDTITLRDKNKYMVISKIDYHNNTYYYLINEVNSENIKFCLEKNERKTLIEIDDTNLIQTLLPIFAGSINSEHLKANH